MTVPQALVLPTSLADGSSVAVCVGNEDEFLAIVDGLYPHVGPQLRSVARFLVLEGASLFPEASKENVSIKASLRFHLQLLGVDWRDLHIQRTFLDATDKTIASSRASPSAPRGF